MEKLSFSFYTEACTGVSAWTFANNIAHLDTSEFKSRYRKLPYLNKLFSNVSWSETSNNSTFSLEEKDTWKVLVKETEGDGSDSEEGGEGESSITTEFNLSNLENSWNSSIPSSPIGQLNWRFVPRSLPNRDNTWIKDISKWLGKDSLITTALVMYAEITGTFIEAPWTI